MILTKEQSEKRLTSEKNIANSIEATKVEIVIKDGKNHIGNLNRGNPLTEDERIAVGVLSKTMGGEIAAEMFGISTSTAYKLSSGTRSGDNGKSHDKDMVLVNKIEERLQRTKLSIQERAAEKLIGAMGLIDNDKLENSTAKDLAQISNQMSQVMRNMNNASKDNNSNRGGVKITLHQPKEACEDSFDVIEISAG